MGGRKLIDLRARYGQGACNRNRCRGCQHIISMSSGDADWRRIITTPSTRRWVLVTPSTAWSYILPDWKICLSFVQCQASANVELYADDSGIRIINANYPDEPFIMPQTDIYELNKHVIQDVYKDRSVNRQSTGTYTRLFSGHSGMYHHLKIRKELNDSNEADAACVYVERTDELHRRRLGLASGRDRYQHA